MMHTQPQTPPPSLELPRGLLVANVVAFTGALALLGILFAVMPRLETSEIGFVSFGKTLLVRKLRPVCYWSCPLQFKYG